MTERPSSSQAVARVSVKDRLGPLPPQQQYSSKRRDRSVERSHKRGRKFSKTNGQDKPEPSSKRVSVHERLGPLPPQAFKKNDLFFKRNRQQVWRHQGNFKQAPSKEFETPAIANVENVEKVKPPNATLVLPPARAPVPALPIVQPFNAEQHRQTWTWVRPTTNSTAMEVDEST